jgi:hypothetical protein
VDEKRRYRKLVPKARPRRSLWVKSLARNRAVRMLLVRVLVSRPGIRREGPATPGLRMPAHRH